MTFHLREMTGACFLGKKQNKHINLLSAESAQRDTRLKKAFHDTAHIIMLNYIKRK